MNKPAGKYYLQTINQISTLQKLFHRGLKKQKEAKRWLLKVILQHLLFEKPQKYYKYTILVI